MFLSSYDSLTETAYIFFGGRSTFFVTEYYSFTRVLRKLFVIDQNNQTETWSRLPYHDSIFSANPQTSYFYGIKTSRFSPISGNFLFRRIFTILNSASFFFWFIHYEEENQAAFFIGEISGLYECFSFYFYIAIFQKIQKNCQICIRIMFK